MKLIRLKNHEVASHPKSFWKLRFSTSENLDPSLKKLSLNSGDTHLDFYYEPTQLRATFDSVEVGKKPRSFRVDGHTYIIFLISGDAKCTIYPGEKVFSLKKHSALYFTSSDLNLDSTDEILILVESKASTSRFFLIELAKASTTAPQQR